MSFTPYRVAPPRKRKPPRTAEALDVAVRYFLDKLYDASPSTTSRSATIAGSLSVTGTTSSDDVAQVPRPIHLAICTLILSRIGADRSWFSCGRPPRGSWRR